jgi:hypothetical protein
LSLCFARFLSVFTACGPFRIRKNAPQNNPTEAFTKRLSHEFRNKIERPRAMRVTAFMTVLWSDDDEIMGRFGWTSIENSCFVFKKTGDRLRSCGAAARAKAQGESASLGSRKLINPSRVAATDSLWQRVLSPLRGSD